MKEKRDIAIEIRLLASVLLKTTAQSMEQRLADMDISLSRLQFHLLHFASMEALSITEASKRMGLDPSTVSSSVDTLTRKGLIKRERDPNDRRRVQITTTDEGRNIIERCHIIPDDDPTQQAIMALGADAEILHQLLHQAVRNLPDSETVLADMQARFALFQSKPSISRDASE